MNFDGCEWFWGVCIIIIFIWVLSFDILRFIWKFYRLLDFFKIVYICV